MCVLANDANISGTSDVRYVFVPADVWYKCVNMDVDNVCMHVFVCYVNASADDADLYDGSDVRNACVCT